MQKFKQRLGNDVSVEELRGQLFISKAPHTSLLSRFLAVINPYRLAGYILLLLTPLALMFFLGEGGKNTPPTFMLAYLFFVLIFTVNHIWSSFKLTSYAFTSKYYEITLSENGDLGVNMGLGDRDFSEQFGLGNYMFTSNVREYTSFMESSLESRIGERPRSLSTVDLVNLELFSVTSGELLVVPIFMAVDGEEAKAEVDKFMTLLNGHVSLPESERVGIFTAFPTEPLYKLDSYKSSDEFVKSKGLFG
ncbi:hypothetical protein VCHA53O466_50075 [Vibrio chagasii]|nr:hypothetical protein VCHA53O466_50075 [Vibrio chagasii]